MMELRTLYATELELDEPSSNLCLVSTSNLCTTQEAETSNPPCTIESRLKDIVLCEESYDWHVGEKPSNNLEMALKVEKIKVSTVLSTE